MAERRCFCGIDVGTQGVRAALIDDEGREVGAGSSALSSSRRSGPLHEQQPDEWWGCLVSAVRRAFASAAAPVSIAAVALDATSGTVVLEGADGSVRGPALMYDDARATQQAERAERVGGALWSALGYRMQPTWALPKALWLLEHADLQAGDRIVHQSDYLVRRLAGHSVATDTSHALKMGADLRDGTWPSEVFAELGMPLERLPGLVSPTTPLGQVGRTAAAQTGLPAGVTVRAGMTDGCASQIAAGALATGSWSSALGTTLVVKGATEELIRDAQGAVYCHRHPDGGWLPGGASSTGAGVLRAMLPTGADLDMLTAQARDRVPFPGVTYPLAGHGERFPFIAPQAHGFVAEQVTDDADRFAALCQGVSYVERLAYDVLAVLGADVSGPTSLTGGGARNMWWNQLRTDVLGRPTVRPVSAEPATGMAILAAAEPGSLSATAERMVVVAERLEPDAERGRMLRSGYVLLVEELAHRTWLDADLAEAVLSRSGAVA